MPRSSAVVSSFALGAAAIAAWVLAAWSASAQTPAPRTVRDRVFSSAQVERGRRQFHSICMNCHELAEFTDPGAYLEEKNGKTVWESFEYIWAEMPEDEPASLDPKDYAAILAFMLSAYGMPAGDTDLPIDRKSLEAIRFAKPPG